MALRDQVVPPGKALLGLLLLSVIVRADDCSVGTEGGNVFVEFDNDVEMAREEVLVKMFPDSAIVDCKFWFYNKAESEDRSVGFPNYWVDAPQASTPLRNFRTWVNGKETRVHTKYQSIIEIDGTDTLPGGDKEWFVWETNFRKHDTTFIENRYAADYSGCACAREKSIEYVLGTGRTWSSSIGKGTVIFDFGNMISSSWIKAPPVRNPVIKQAIDEGRVRFEFGKYEPKENDRFSLSFFCPWDSACTGIVDSGFVKFLLGKNKRQLKEMRNEIFARHGYAFNDNELALLFSGKPWYKAKKDFDAAMLPKVEARTVAEIKRIEGGK